MATVGGVAYGLLLAGGAHVAPFYRIPGRARQTLRAQVKVQCPLPTWEWMGVLKS